MKKALTLASAAAVGAGAVIVVATAPAAVAATGDLASGTYSIPYSDALVKWDEPSETLTQLTYDQWKEEGFPAPISTVAESAYARYPWSPGIVGATVFTAPDAKDPKFFFAGLTPQTWARAGNPTPDVVADQVLPGSAIIKYSSSDELFVGDATATIHKLTLGEWNGLGNPEPTTVGSVQKYSFNDTLYLYLDGSEGENPVVVALTSPTWNALANPTPSTPQDNRLPSDAVFAFSDNPGDIYLRTPTKQVWHLTFDEWASMGGPKPDLVTPPGDDASGTPSAASGADTAAHRTGVAIVSKALGQR